MMDISPRVVAHNPSGCAPQPPLCTPQRSPKTHHPRRLPPPPLPPLSPLLSIHAHSSRVALQRVLSSRVALPLPAMVKRRSPSNSGTSTTASRRPARTPSPCWPAVCLLADHTFGPQPTVPLLLLFLPFGVTLGRPAKKSVCRASSISYTSFSTTPTTCRVVDGSTVIVFVNTMRPKSDTM